MDKIQAYINAHSKNHIIGLLVTIFFGPLGLFYSNWIVALILTILVIVSITTLIFPIILWILSILLNGIFIEMHNKKVKATAEILAS